MSADRLARIDQMVNDNITKKKIPGAVVLIARNGKIVYNSPGINTGDKFKVLTYQSIID